MGQSLAEFILSNLSFTRKTWPKQTVIGIEAKLPK